MFIIVMLKIMNNFLRVASMLYKNKINPYFSKNYLYKMKHLLSLFFLLIFMSPLAIAQKKGKPSKAEKAFLLQNYYEAELLYKEEYSKEKNRARKAELIFFQAECGRLIGTPIHNKKAVNLYKRAIKAKYPHPIVFLRYAQVLQKQQNFSEAMIQYEKYKSFKPNDQRAENGIKSCVFALDALENPTRYEVTRFQYNSNAADYAPSFGSSDYKVLFFTSSRDESVGKSTDGFSGDKYTDLFSVKRDRKGKWTRPVPFPEPMNTKNHEAATSLNGRGNEMYFTRCYESTKQKPIPTCEIYYSKKKGKGWTSPVLVPLPYDSISTFGHPSISSNGKVLYFSSDMKGGYGGKDIWFIKKEKRDEWSEPVNMGSEINTEGNELFPFIHQDGSLYFSSDALVGMGGHDIFRAEFDEENNLRSVSNMKSPINSPNDDFGIVFEGKNERGYFSSNRVGSRGDDIYQFNLPLLDLSISGVASDDNNNKALAGAVVTILGNDGSSSQVVTDNAGFYKFGKDVVKEGIAYELTVSKEGYLTKNATQTTLGVKQSKNFDVNISLVPTQKEIILPKIEYDYNSASLRPQSKKELDNLVEVLKNHLNVVIQLRSHTDNRAGDDFNLKLSQQRAQVCVDYMVSKGIKSKRLKAVGMGESEPYVMDVKNGRLKKGDILDEEYINKLKRKKDIEKSHQYNRRTDFKVLSDLFYDIESDKVISRKKK